MWSCDQNSVTLAFLLEKLSLSQFYEDLIRKTNFFEGWSWFQFSNLVMVLVMSWRFYTSVAKWLKLGFKKCLWLIPTFVEVTGELGLSFSE